MKSLKKNIFVLAIALVALGVFILVKPIRKQPMVSNSHISDQSPTAVQTKEQNNPVVTISTWKNYENIEYQYSFQYPPTLTTTTTLYSVLFQNQTSEPKAQEFPFFYISVIPDTLKTAKSNPSIYNFMTSTEINSFFQMKVGETKQYPKAPAEYWIYKKLPSITVSGNEAIVIENSRVWDAGEKAKDRRIFVRKNGNTYMIGCYYESSETLITFDQILSTFSIK